MRGIKQTEATKRRRAPTAHTRTCSPLYFIPFCRRTETEGQINTGTILPSNIPACAAACSAARANERQKNIATVDPGCVDEVRHRHARGSASVAPVLISLWSARMTTTTIEGRMHKPTMFWWGGRRDWVMIMNKRRRRGEGAEGRGLMMTTRGWRIEGERTAGFGVERWSRARVGKPSRAGG